MKHYKLSFLRRVRHGASWEQVYIQVDNDGEPKIILYHPATEAERPLNSKIETLTEEEFRKIWDESRVDSGH